MTSNERIILKCLWDAKGKAHICFISRATGLSSDYARLLARSLERGGYLEFADVNVCCLLTKGRNRFSAPEERDLDSGGQDSGPIIVETEESDTIVNPEIIVETEDKSQDVDLDNDEEETMDSDEKSEDENKQDEDLDQVLTELDQFVKKETVPESFTEPELAEEESSEAGLPAQAGDEKLVEEIQNEILEEEAELDELKDATPQEKEKLVEAGYKSVEDLAQAPVNRLIQSIGVNLKKAANWINQARRKTGVIHDEKVESKK
ncbi:MAG: helix-hairpin-helix domain-containing protein [bacterium]|nr:helix-hairpin-helix domain-containing protein [bacterium]